MGASLYTKEEIADIYDRQTNTVYRVCFSFMKNATDAEDMVQETFLKLIACRKQFESEEHEKAWLIVTASNTCKDELRRWKRRQENMDVFSQEENIVRAEDDSVLEWVMELPAKYKQVVYLYYYEGYRTAEIAGMLHCPESTVRNQLLRGRKLLKKHREAHTKPLILLAAVLACSLLVTTVAYAVHYYRLRDLVLRKETILDLSEQTQGVDEIAEKDISTREVDIISLGGIAESPECMACSEWRAFLEGYDTDKAILSEIGNGLPELDGEYESVYGCYSQEMADELNTLCEKYGLSKLNGFYIAEDYDDLCRRAKIGNIFGGTPENVSWNFGSSYLYADGTFHMEGCVTWKGSSLCMTDYQLVRTMKGSFNPVVLNIGAAEAYNEWNYTTKNGEAVLLANSSTKALIIVEKENSFIVVNVLGNLLTATFEVSDEMLERLADAFDFSAVP